MSSRHEQCKELHARGIAGAEIARLLGITRQAANAAIKYIPGSGTRGPKRKTPAGCCNACGVALSPENIELGTLYRCKQCASDYVIKHKAKKLTDEQIKAQITRHARVLELYQTILEERTK
jgi:DNA-directed RNA polymerase subunit RPC12/RpoP